MNFGIFGTNRTGHVLIMKVSLMFTVPSFYYALFMMRLDLYH